MAGGGTAGHVNPGLAIADALVERGLDPSAVHWVGSSRGLEATAVPAADYGMTLLSGRGIERRISTQNVAAILGILRASVEAVRLLRSRRPAIVVSLGGYASVPCSLAAALLGIPLVVAEQNTVPGLANRLASRFARASAVTFPGTPLRRAVVTGNPLRSAVTDIDRKRDCAGARQTLELPVDHTVILVFGGSLGATRINRAVVALAEAWGDRRDVAIRHVIGERDWNDLPAPDVGPDGLVYQRVRYEDRMPLALAAADVAVCRAGATTVTELAAVGLPALFVPYPYATGDHQTANARFLVDEGAGVLLVDAELTGGTLQAALEPLIGDPTALAAMADAAASLAVPDAAAQVASLVEEHASRRSCGSPARGDATDD